MLKGDCIQRVVMHGMISICKDVLMGAAGPAPGPILFNIFIN